MKFSDAAKKVISAVAPTIATALGGPLAGAATAELVKKFGGDERAAEQALASASPEALVTLKQAEVDFQKFLLQHEINLEEIHARDRDSARKRQIEVKDDTPKVLAYAYLSAFMVLVTMQFWIIIDAVAMQEGATRILDSLTAIMGTLVGGSKEYYFGSSAGSQRKTEMLTK